MASLLQSLYPSAPVWAQNLGISLFGLSWRQERLGGRFHDYVDGFRQRDRWSPERMHEYLERQLQHTLAAAFADVPYYQKKWAGEGIRFEDLGRFRVSQLSQLPTTPKQDVRMNPGQFISTSAARNGRLHRYFTSGTTGTPITAVCTSMGHRKFIAAREVRSFGWAGTTLRASRSTIGGRLVVPRGPAKPPFHRCNWAENQIYFSAYHISPANAPHYVRALNQHQPKVLIGYAYSHYLLAQMMLRQGLTLNYQPDALVLGSEPLTGEMKSVLRKAFNARPYEEYGCVENCVLATECEFGQLHVSTDFGLLEIVDEQGQPVPAGNQGRIVCTSLLNEVQPLIRYEVGDLGVWSDKKCPCGRDHLPVIKEIVGRIEDVVTGPDGRQLVRFHGIFIDLPNVLEGQVIQEAQDRFTIKVVTRPGFGEREVHAIHQRMEERLGTVQVIVEPVKEIPRSAQGKFRAVISQISSTHRSTGTC